MLIQGTPDILTPPASALSGYLGGLSGAAESDPYWDYRVGQVRYLWGGSAAPWEKAAALTNWMSQWRWTASDFAQAAGVSLEQMQAVLSGPKTQAQWEQSQALRDIVEVETSSSLKPFQKVTVMRDIAQTYGLTSTQIAQALGITEAELDAWFYGAENWYRVTLAPLLSASWLTPGQMGAGLRDYAIKQGLTVTDLSRITGQTTDAINRLLAVASPGTYPGAHIGVSATATNPGIAIVAGSGVSGIVPAGSDPIVNVFEADPPQVLTSSGIQAATSRTVRGLPINSAGVGAVAFVMGNQNMTLADKARGIAAIQAKFGLTDDEMSQYAEVGGLTFQQFIAAGTATYAAYAPDQIAFGPRSITNNEDAELWDLFNGIWNDASLTLDQKISGVVDAMIENDIGLYDLSRITGFDAVAWQQTLGVSADFNESRTVPVVVAPDLVDTGREVMQSSVYETESPAAQAADGPGGIGIVAFHQRIRDFVASAGSDYRAVVDNMQTWGVSLDDIRAALFNVPGSDAWIAGLVDYINAPPAPPPKVVIATEVRTDATKPPADSAVDQPATVLTNTSTSTTVDTGAAMLTVPNDLTSRTAAQKVAWYRAAIAAGYSDAAIRAAVETKFGAMSSADWSYLRTQAAYSAPAGAGLLIAAAAAYFLLG